MCRLFCVLWGILRVFLSNDGMGCVSVKNFVDDVGCTLRMVFFCPYFDHGVLRWDQANAGDQALVPYHGVNAFAAQCLHRELGLK